MDIVVRSARSMSKARMDYVDGGLARGCRGWHVTLEELTAKRESMRKSLGHRRSRGVSRGFDASRCLVGPPSSEVSTRPLARPPKGAQKKSLDAAVA